MTEAFGKAVALVFAHNEVLSLRETVQSIAQSCQASDIARIVIFLALHATEQCCAEAQRLAGNTQLPIAVIVAQEQGRGFAVEVPQLLSQQNDATHVAIWAADLDTPPHLLAHMLAAAKQQPAAVIKLSRFVAGGQLSSRRVPRVLFRYAVNLLYRSQQTDPHHGECLFPLAMFLRFRLTEKHMAFFLEYSLCFERMGVPFIELPKTQQLRREGKSNMSLRKKMRYLVPLVRVRMLPRRKIIK
ncbi:MAG: hypothetical protein FWB76_02840 [Oscillospiraceae bacterium]|nr:hypothetical protein [Oscillospiraceae bacterium]